MAPAASTFRFAQGLEKTFQTLSRTTNEAALGALVPALDSTQPVIQQCALKALLERRSGSGQREVLQRLHTAGVGWREIIETRKGLLTPALGEALLGDDAQMFRNACQAILWFREYDLVPTLLTVVEDEANPYSRLAGETLLSLTDLLCAETESTAGEANAHHDRPRLRERVAASLDASVRRFGQHERSEVVNAFLLLAQRENRTLRQILQDPLHRTLATLTDPLLHDQRPAVVQLLLSFLEDAHAPSAVLSIVSRRQDPAFVQALLAKMAEPLSLAASQNLGRMESLACLNLDACDWESWDAEAQQSLVKLIVASGTSRRKSMDMLQLLAAAALPAGRSAAVEAAARLDGEDGDATVTQALDDADAQVQSMALAQLRKRNLRGGLLRLVQAIDSPHDRLRRTARANLPEFGFDRYAAAFDLLDQDVRRTAGNLVRQANPEAIASLAAELRDRSCGQRMRTLAIADSMGVLPNLQVVLIELLHDEDEAMRREAAAALGQCDTVPARHALYRSLWDHSHAVQEAVRHSLEKLEEGRRAETGPRLAQRV